MTHKARWKLADSRCRRGGGGTDGIFFLVWVPACFISCWEIKELQFQFSFRSRVQLHPDSVLEFAENVWVMVGRGPQHNSELSRRATNQFCFLVCIFLRRVGVQLKWCHSRAPRRGWLFDPPGWWVGMRRKERPDFCFYVAHSASMQRMQSNPAQLCCISAFLPC